MKGEAHPPQKLTSEARSKQSKKARLNLFRVSETKKRKNLASSDEST